MVSARVPAELRDQVNGMLRSEGYTPTELVNSAYEFFLKEKKLPVASAGVAVKGKKRTLTKAQRAQLTESLEKTTFAVPESFFEGTSYEKLLEEELSGAYEALA